MLVICWLPLHGEPSPGPAPGLLSPGQLCIGDLSLSCSARQPGTGALHIGPPYGNPLYQSFTVGPLGVFGIGFPGLMSALRKWKNLLKRGLPWGGISLQRWPSNQEDWSSRRSCFVIFCFVIFFPQSSSVRRADRTEPVLASVWHRPSYRSELMLC